MNQCAEIAIYLDRYLGLLYNLPYLLISMSLIVLFFYEVIFYLPDPSVIKEVRLITAIMISIGILFFVIAPEKIQTQRLIHQKMCGEKCCFSIREKQRELKAKEIREIREKIFELKQKYEGLSGNILEINEFVR